MTFTPKCGKTHYQVHLPHVHLCTWTELTKKKKSEFHAKLYNMILHWEVGDKLLLSKVAQNICQQETLRDSNMVKIDIPSGVTQMEKTI